MDQNSRRYLDLLKITLTDYLRVDNPFANAMPIEYLRPGSGLRRWRNRVLAGTMRLFGFALVKPNRKSIDDRRQERAYGVDWPPLAETMVGLERLHNLERLITEVVDNDVPGDLLEAGVWRGGASIFMQAMLTVLEARDRNLWLCDSFEGLPPPDPAYPSDAGFKFHEFSILGVARAVVEENFRRYDLHGDNLRFVEGYFEKTLATAPVGPLALLRMDGDMYSSTIATLEPLYDKVSTGGFVIADDYHIGACAEAIHDFRKAHGITDEIVKIDQAAAYWQKS